MGTIYLPRVYQIDKSNANFIRSIKKYNKNCKILGHNHYPEAPKDGTEAIATDFKGHIIDEALDSIIGENKDTRVHFNIRRSSSEILPPRIKQSFPLPEEDHFAFCKIYDFINSALDEDTDKPVLDQPEIKISDLNLMMHALNKQYPVSGAVKLDNGLLFAIKDKIFHLSQIDNHLSITTLDYFGVDLDDGFVCPSVNLKKQLDSKYFQPFKERNYSGELFPENINNFSFQNISILDEDCHPPLIQILQCTIKRFESRYGTQDQLTKIIDVFYHLNENEQEEYSKQIYMTNALLEAKMTGIVPEEYVTKDGDDFDSFLEHYLLVAKGTTNSNSSLTCKVIGSCMMLLGLSLIIAGTTLSLLSLGISVIPGASLIAGGVVIGASGLGLFAIGRSKALSTTMANCGEQIAEAQPRLMIS